MSFADTPTMAAYLPAYLQPWAPPRPKLKQVPFLPTTTDRDWSAFDAPAKTRMTARRVRPAKPLQPLFIVRQAD